MVAGEASDLSMQTFWVLSALSVCLAVTAGRLSPLQTLTFTLQAFTGLSDSNVQDALHCIDNSTLSTQVDTISISRIAGMVSV